MNQYTRLLASVCIALASEVVSAAEVPVATPAELLHAVEKAKPGDTIMLGDGDWNDVIIRMTRDGTPEQPVTIAAKTPGKAVLRGSSRVLLDAKHVVARGLRFAGESKRAGGVRGAAVEFTEKSDHCRLTQCAIDGYDVAGGVRDNWVNIWGTHNRVDHFAFLNKGNVGELLRVRRDENRSDKHRIDHNYFGPRPPVKGNGGETIQIGLKEQQFTESNSVVEHNLFEECDGEIELMSVKSSGNAIRHNTMLRCASRITLRHGSNNRVEGNFIVGDGKAGTGGVRVYGKDHVVTQNFVTGTAGTGDQGGAINLHSGDNSDPREVPANGVAAQNCTVSSNTLVNNRTGIVIGSGKVVAPSNVTLTNNLVVTGAGTLLDLRAKDPVVKFGGNVFFGGDAGVEFDGITYADPKLTKTTAEGYPYFKPAADSAANDIGETAFRSDKLKPMKRGDVGPAWMGGPSDAQ